jgi:hypothetical protein
LRAQDGTLSDAELNAFQVACFSAPLQPEELAGVKKVVSEKMPQVGSASHPSHGLLQVILVMGRVTRKGISYTVAGVKKVVSEKMLQVGFMSHLSEEI